MYNLEIDKAIKEIKQSKPKTILIQLADGLKPQATEIVKQLQPHTKAKIYISLNSCYGACDIPNVDVDLLIHFGHNSYL
ncbi:MAG: diphthamide synthesis protein [archaeon]